MKRISQGTDSQIEYDGWLPPVEFYAIYGNRQNRLSNEQRLLLAILGDAAEIIMHGPPAGNYSARRQTYNEALAWVRGRRPSGRYGFSFDDVCDSLGIDAGAVREQLLTLSATSMVAGMSRRLMPKHYASGPFREIDTGTYTTRRSRSRVLWSIDY
jgi:hypothetical protein